MLPIQTITLAPTTIELAAANVASQAQIIASQPCTSVAEDAALSSQLNAATKAIKAIDDARLEIARPVNAALTELKAYTDNLAQPLQIAIEQGKAKRLAFAKAQADAAAKAKQEANAKAARLQAMQAELSEFWAAQFARAKAITTIEELEASRKLAVGFTPKNQNWLEFADTWQGIMDTNKAALLRLFDDLILAARTPMAPLVELPTVQVSTANEQLLALTEAPLQVASKGVSTTLVLEVPDWRAVDATAWLAAMMNNPKAGSELIEHLYKLAVRFTPKGTPIHGFVWKEEIKVSNRA